MEKNELKQIIIEQNLELNSKSKLIKRELLSKIVELKEIPHIIIISGLRRAGKSILLKEIKDLLYDSHKYNYINFEDELLLDFKVTDFSMLYETFLQLDESINTFFLDEIQNIENWEIAIRKYYEKKNKFYITGSNASLLSKELGTKLTGRNITLTLFPFSFKEYLDFNNFELVENYSFISKEKSKILNFFEEFLHKGGIPEYLIYKRKEIIQNVYKDIIYKDILVRYNLTNEKILRELSKYLISNIGKEFSYNKLKKLFNLGSSNTIKDYISYLENSFLIFTLERYDFSYKKQIISQKKVYAIDPAFIENVSFKVSKDLGRLLENLVFIELRRRGLEIYFHREKKECDFIIKNNLDITQAIQVCYDLNQENKEREIGGLIEALNSYKLKEGLLLTYDYEEELVIKNKKILIKPVWKWLLD